MNISTILDMAAEAFGDRIGVVCGDSADLRRAARGGLPCRCARSSARARSTSRCSTSTVRRRRSRSSRAAYAGVPYVPLNYRLTERRSTS